MSLLAVDVVGLKHYLLAFCFILLWSISECLRLLPDLICHPMLFFKRPMERLAPPQCLLDASLGKHVYIRANGIKFDCVISGDDSKPLMLFLHGYPEFWYSWHHQIRAFSKDYHVVAVDLRGYGETDCPPKTQDYVLTNLRLDIVELIPALGHSTAILVAHDCEGFIAWAVTQKHPELVEKLVIMNAPHLWVFKNIISNTWAQLMKSWYIFVFHLPWLPEFVMAQRDFDIFNDIFRGKKMGVRNQAAFLPEVIEAYKYVFSQPGAITGPINYYRCIFKHFSVEESKIGEKIIDVSTLIIWGNADEFFERSMVDAHSDFVTNLTVKHIPKCSHWVQQDQPDLVNQYMREFLTSS